MKFISLFLTAFLCSISTLAVTLTAGATHLCVGDTTYMSVDTSGGTWSSSSIYSLDNIGLMVIGISPGTETITYTLSTGSSITLTFTVSNPPPAITGLNQLCLGFSTTLHDSATGTWASSNSSIATAGSATGVITGVSVGSAYITFTLSTGCRTSTEVTVNPNPAPVTGLSTVCSGVSASLSDASTGGNWSCSNTLVTNISSSGILTGINSGTSTISYTLVTGCFVTHSMTVNPIPHPYIVTGGGSYCAGGLGVLVGLSGSDVGIEYQLYSGLLPLGAPLSGTGLSLNFGSQTALGVYKVEATNPTTGCYGIMSDSAIITVIPSPRPITGITQVCLGYSTALSDSGVGAWSTSNAAIASVAPLTGIVTGVAMGTAFITFTLGSGCSTSTEVTVYPNPTSIIGTTVLCVGSSTTLSNGTAGGTWVSSNSTIASIIGTLGFTTGLAPGTSIISYTLSTGCYVTSTITVDPIPTGITGASSVCVGSSVALSESVAGGIWTSGSSLIATIGSSTGSITGIAAGTVVISYTIGIGCTVTRVETVMPGPAPITGATTVCVGSIFGISDAIPGGTWSSSSTGIVSVGLGTGIITGVSAGTAIVSYTLSTGCFVTATLTVFPIPGSITGPSSVCTGSTIALGDVIAGGSWTSGSIAHATAGSSGIVTGVSMGTAIISYSMGGACYATKTITINPNPSAISGPTALCAGATNTLTDGVTGGTWTSSNIGIATIGSGSGLVSGLSPGSAIITYTISGLCFTTTTISVSPTPYPIAGPSTVCVGSTITLSDGTGGLWVSGNSNINLGSLSGIVTGLVAGSSTITYSLGTGCIQTKSITVLPGPGLISGPSALCAGSTINLTDGVAGGAWSSSNSVVCTIGSASGVVTGLSPGSAIISYTISGLCFVTTTISINPLPGPITGPSALCQGLTGLYSDAAPGGFWSSSSSGTMSIGSATGIVTALVPGIAIISYSFVTGCSEIKTVTVNPSPSAISGPLAECIGSATTLTDLTSGGIWSSSNTTIATVGSVSGLVSGLLSGTSIISYSLGTGCSSNIIFTVVLPPTPITGPSTVCAGSSAVLTEGGTGGVWSSSNTLVLSISTGGVTGVAPGTATITYSLGSGCFVTKTMTVLAVPGLISGPSAFCLGGAITLTDGTGGSWTSGNTLIATVGSASGVVMGVSSGLVGITYAFADGCFSTQNIIVNEPPTPISGPTSFCSEYTLTLSDLIPGGNWISSNVLVAPIGSSTGIVTGIGAGTSDITYTLADGCFTTRSITVNPAPFAINGLNSICIGTSTTYADGTIGGRWVSSSTATATIGSGSGLINGVTYGSSVITYTLTDGCYAIKIITITPVPSVITGTRSVCTGASSLLSDGVSGGSWASNNTAIATIGSSSGILSGVAVGTAVITYSTGIGCYTTAVATVIPGPGSISGPSSVCQGGTVTLTDGTSGGRWSVSGSGATVGSATGIVSGVTAGTALISYSIGTGCFVVQNLTVNPLPASIAGTLVMCGGLSAIISDATPGGTWTSNSTVIATIGSATGIVTGVMGGTAIISYILPTGCYTLATCTVNTTPANISGHFTVCTGATQHLTDGILGGSWSSSAMAIATIGSTGILTGVSAGTANITYTMGTGCMATKLVTVYASPVITVSSNPASCGEAYTLTATGGGAYSWSPSAGLSCSTCASVTLTPSVSTTYTVTVTNSFLCFTSGTVTPDINRIAGYITFAGTTPDTIDAKVWLIQFHATDSSLHAVDSTVSCISGGLSYYEFMDRPSGNYLVKAKLLHGNPVGSTGYVPTYSLSTQSWDSAYTVSHSTGQDTMHITMIRGIVPSGPGFISGYVNSGAGRHVNPENINSPELLPSLNIYPNPTMGLVNISWNDMQTGPAEIKITDITGRIVYNLDIDIHTQSGESQIDVSGLKEAIYLLSVNSGAIHKTWKLIKMN